MYRQKTPAHGSKAGSAIIGIVHLYTLLHKIYYLLPFGSTFALFAHTNLLYAEILFLSMIYGKLYRNFNHLELLSRLSEGVKVGKTAYFGVDTFL